MRISDWSSDVCSSDLGIDVNDMELVYRETEFVTGVHQVHGGSGDPSPFTAYGALQGLMATLNRKFGDEEVGKYTYAVQGLGHVGMEYVKLLKERGAKIFVTDINKTLVDKAVNRSEEQHTSELQSLMRISSAVFCLKIKTTRKNSTKTNTHK